MISVIIPNYNHAPYLELRIETILQQTFTDFEVIILDDCSTDNSRDIINKYAQNPKISTIIFNEVNSGSTFKQWMKGITLAKGEWILIAESDDWSEPSLLETLYHGATKDPNITLSICQTLSVFDNGTLNIPNFTDMYEVLHDGVTFCKQRLMHSTGIVTAGSALFRKDITENMPDISGYKSAGDMKFWIFVSLTGKVSESGKYLHYWRKHTKNTTTNPKLFFSKLWELYDIYMWAKELKMIDDKKFKERCLFMANFIYRSDKIDDPQALEFLKKVKSHVSFPILKLRYSSFCKSVYYNLNRLTKKLLLNVFMVNYIK